jgi:hypothetical protein
MGESIGYTSYLKENNNKCKCGKESAGYLDNTEAQKLINKYLHDRASSQRMFAPQSHHPGGHIDSFGPNWSYPTYKLQHSVYESFKPSVGQLQVEQILRNARYFIIKSVNYENINFSIKHSEWATTKTNEVSFITSSLYADTYYIFYFHFHRKNSMRRIEVLLMLFSSSLRIRASISKDLPECLLKLPREWPIIGRIKV